MTGNEAAQLEVCKSSVPASRESGDVQERGENRMVATRAWANSLFGEDTSLSDFTWFDKDGSPKL